MEHFQPFRPEAILVQKDRTEEDEGQRQEEEPQERQVVSLQLISEALPDVSPAKLLHLYSSLRKRRASATNFMGWLAANIVLGKLSDLNKNLASPKGNAKHLGCKEELSDATFNCQFVEQALASRDLKPQRSLV